MMFNSSFQSRVSKHLAVFHKAVEGLKQVHADIHKEISNHAEQKILLQNQLHDHENQIDELHAHADQVFETIGKLSTILPKQ